MLKNIVLIFLFIGIPLFAQNKTIEGKVVGAVNKLPLEFVNVLLKNGEKTVTGTVTNNKGFFNLKYEGEITSIQFSFIGLKTKTLSKDILSKGNNLGEITLEESSNELDGIELTEERSKTEFKLDKKVFHVGSDIGSTGASALEVLNNVPSVNVNVEGQISLRGSQGVQILINGKPSVLTSDDGGNALGSITSDMIEKIEVVTNPSAKYEASGTSGIINIVLKKEEKRGFNGSVTLNTGIPNNHSFGLSLNHRSEKINIFSQLGYGYRTFPRNATIESNTLSETLKTEGESDKNEEFFNAILGVDYHFNKSSVLTLSGHYAFEDELENASYTYKQESGTNKNIWERKEKTTATNPKWQYEVQFKKDFDLLNKKEHSLSFSALGSSFSKDKTSNFTNNSLLGTNELFNQRINTNFNQNEYTLKLDFVKPIKETMKLEIGSHYRINGINNDYEVNKNVNNLWVIDSNFSNVFNFNQKVLGLYTTYSYEITRWGFMGGLRMENTDVKGVLENTNEVNKQNYTDLFPTFHSSYKFSEKLSFQAGYSRRIYRPSLWSLNPFTSFRNDFAVRVGNPDLLPEYSDSYELTSIYHYKSGSFNLSAYQRNTTQVIDYILNVDGNKTITRPDNIGSKKTRGMALNWKYTPKDWLSINADINWNWFKRTGSFKENNFDFSSQQWTNKLTIQMQLPKHFKLELVGNYQSAYKNIQGEIGDNLFMNIGLRKKMFKGRLNTNLSIRDVFASRKRKQTTQQGTFYQYSESMQGRFIVLGLSYGFGKGDAMEFSGQKHF